MHDCKTFETERLLLRPTHIEDAEYLLKLLNSPKWLEFIGDRNVHSLEDAEAYIKEKMLPQYERLGYGNYMVIRKADGAKMGNCGLYDRDGLEAVDIGFAFLPDYEQQGYAYESARCILDAAFNEFKIPLIAAITTKANSGSQKLIEKLGLTFKKIINLPDDPEDLMLYEIKNPNR